ncbi:uncharacterized protein [Apostichopus japonicus]|uniref:uncharacterized protein isoform X2 n=1 Tax=Stichopus japonicus TaxID=307972 RepID=UPI003AB329AF
MEYRITFAVIGAGVTYCWSNGTAATNPETDNSPSETTEPQFTTTYTTETTKPENHCAPPKHGYLGKEGIISCNIDQGMNVYWFNETDEYHHSFIRMEDGYITGSGYKSNEYDILQNGSLVIRNVQYKHQQSYQVTFPFDIGSQVDLRVDFLVIVPTTSNSGSTLPSEVTSIVQSTKVEDSNRAWLHLIWIVVVVAVAVVVVVLVASKKRARPFTNQEGNGNNEGNEENIPMRGSSP